MALVAVPPRRRPLSTASEQRIPWDPIGVGVLVYAAAGQRGAEAVPRLATPQFVLQSAVPMLQAMLQRCGPAPPPPRRYTARHHYTPPTPPLPHFCALKVLSLGQQRTGILFFEVWGERCEEVEQSLKTSSKRSAPAYVRSKCSEFHEGISSISAS